MISVKEKQLCDINHFQQSMHCDLDLLPFDPEFIRANPGLKGCVPVKFHEDRCIGEVFMRMKPFYLSQAL